MREEQLYASGRPFKPKTNADNIPVKDNYKLTSKDETTMQEIINAIADRVVNRLLEKSELSDWAKQESKPVYTASEVGADTSGSAQQALTNARTYADNTYTQATGYTDAAIARLINGAPTTLDTLKEIADAMADNESVVDALADAIGTKASEVEAQAHYGNTTVHITASERNTWNNKVDKAAGKVLSTNDYTTDEKEKLGGIASGAEKNVQSDWIVTDTSSNAFIKNKPVIPTVGNGTITIKQNGTQKGTFTTNQSGNTTIELTDSDTKYTLPLASASIRGGGKIGYTANGRNYPVQLNNEQMYVNVPWTDTTTTPDYSNMVDLSGYLVYNTLKTYKPPRAGIISISFYASDGTNNAISVEHHGLTRYMTVCPQYGVVNTSCDFVVDANNVNLKQLSDKIVLRHAKYIPLK